MKKISLLFVIIIALAVKSNAQQASENRFENKNVESVKLHSSQISDANIKSNTVITNNNIVINKELKENLLQETPFVFKNKDEIKNAVPLKVIRMDGQPASLSNQPLQKHDGNLMPVKVK